MYVTAVSGKLLSLLFGLYVTLALALSPPTIPMEIRFWTKQIQL